MPATARVNNGRTWQFKNLAQIPDCLQSSGLVNVTLDAPVLIWCSFRGAAINIKEERLHPPNVFRFAIVVRSKLT